MRPLMVPRSSVWASVCRAGLAAVVLALSWTAPAFVRPAAAQSVVATIPVGRGPAGVAVNPVTTRVYTANQFDHTVSVIDGVTNAVIATVPVGATPISVAVNPVTNRIYVNGYENNTVSVIDGIANLVIAIVPVGTNPYGVAVNPTTNRVYTANAGNKTVSVIDGVTNAVIATVPVGASPISVAVNPATNRVYSDNVNDNTVSVIDGATNLVIATVGVGLAAYGFAVNPATNRVYYGNVNDNTVSVIDGATNFVIATVPVGRNPHDSAVNPTTNRVYTGNLNDFTVSVIDGATNAVIATVPVGDSPISVAVNPATNRVYTANVNANTVSVIADVQPAFPATLVLDDFNRAAGNLGANWTGATKTGFFRVFANQLEARNSGYVYWNPTSFGSDQEAYVTFRRVSRGADEQDLLLKVNGIAPDGGTGGSNLSAIEVQYDAVHGQVLVNTSVPYTTARPSWVTHYSAPLTLRDGDQFGARSLADGTVQIYRNGALVGQTTVTEGPNPFPVSLAAGGGRIGLWVIGATIVDASVMDDFGGGTVAP